MTSNNASSTGRPTAARHSLLNLPISSAAPIYHLHADCLFPTPASLLALSSYEPPVDLASAGPVALKEGDPIPPSMLRRSRQVRGGATFTYTSPLPIEFPYDITEPQAEEESSGGDDVKVVGEERQAKAETIETALARLEIDPQVAVGGERTAFSCKERQGSKFPEAKLLSFSERCRNEWLPQLLAPEESEEAKQAMVDVFSGKTVLAREPDGQAKDQVGKLGFSPWSLCYGGHQFGSWAGQLGDGRAISILSTPTTPEVKAATGYHTLEVQLKGAGRTPYSRFADGLAVLRSSVREYLGAEAMAALGLPTSRALALIGIDSVKVRRETIETAAIVARVGQSWIRIGNFEIQHFRQEWESLRLLTRYTGRQVFAFDDATAPSGEARGLGLNVLKEVSRRNALMIAGWQAYGFMHGVMNTDNIAISGDCIDYGPYAFMDVFDPMHICNHSDDMGRYSFRNQPTMGLFAITKLGTSLAELIGCELDILATEEGAGKKGYVEVDEAWGEGGEAAGWMAGWKEKGMAKLEEVKKEFVEVFQDEYVRLVRLRLGLSTSQGDDLELAGSFLDLLQLHDLDFTNSFRLLSQFPSDGVDSPLFSKFLDLFRPASAASPTLSLDQKSQLEDWFKKYAARLNVAGEVAEGRRERMNAVNPRFTLRQWVLEETIKTLDHGKGSTEQLERVLELSGAPFESYGEVLLEGACALEGEEAKERRRLCGVGSDQMLGFQCSCSS